MAPSQAIPSRKRRSIFRRLGQARRRGQATQGTQSDYRQRWPTVTTLVEQRSETRLPPDDDDQAPKTTKIKALEAAAVPVQWLQCRLESVQDRLDNKIDDAQAKGQKRPSTAPETGSRTSARQKKPGQTTHPYDTDVVPRPAVDDDDSLTTRVQQFETHIFADPPPEPRKTWRVRLANKAKTPKVARSDTARSSEEALVLGDRPHSLPTSPEQTWKCAKERRPTAYPSQPLSQSPKAGVGVPVVREPDLSFVPWAKASPSSMDKEGKAKANKPESRPSPLSNGSRTPDSPTPRRPSLPRPTSSAGSQPHSLLSSAKADLLNLFASRPTSAGSDAGGAAAGRAPSDHKMQLPPRTCSKGAARVDISPPPLGIDSAVPVKNGIPPSLGGGTPKAGALRHMLEWMKMAPPSRTVSPMDLEAECGSGPKHASGQADAGTSEH